MTVSNKVMKMNEWKGTSIYYKVSCACGGGDDCDCGIDFEIDKDFGDIEVNFYQVIKWADYWKCNWFFTRWWARIKVALKILWTGEMRLEGGFLVQGQEHIDSILDAWQEGKLRMIQWRQEFEAEQEKIKKQNEEIDNEN